MLASLRQLQEQFFQGVYGVEIPQDPEVEFYRDLSRQNLLDVQDALFPMTKLVFGEDEWAGLGERFIELCPPQDFRLNWAFEKFSVWLPSHAWIKELANYEWARFQALSARNPQPEDWINPTLCVRAYEFAIPRWYLKPEGQPKGGACWVALFRDQKSEQVRVLEIHPVAYEFLLLWMEGTTPYASAQTVADQLHQPVDRVFSSVEIFLKTFVQEGVLLRHP